MDVRIACQPSYSLAYCTLDHGESMYAERGAMALMSAGVAVSAGVGSGGMARAAMRKAFGGESFFMGQYTAEVHGAWVAVAPKYPGDIDVVDLEETGGLVIERGAFLAAGQKVSVNVKYAGLRNVVMREGASFLHLTGAGLGLMCSYGGLQSYELGEGQELVVDTGHIVGFSDTVNMRVGPLSSVSTAVVTGEGLVALMTGPGRVWAQTRAESGLRDWLFPDAAQDTGRT
jgi:uncharacterized protein (TIGR00266 family)